MILLKTSCNDETSEPYKKYFNYVQVAVIGVPDKRLGQNICACIIPAAGTTLTAEDMLQCFDNLYQTDEGLGMTPAYFMFLSEFPTVNAKANRKELQRMAIEKFDL